MKDPVCGMDVDPATSAHRSERDGQTFSFCSEHCQAKFETSPETYLSPHLTHHTITSITTTPTQR